MDTPPEFNNIEQPINNPTTEPPVLPVKKPVPKKILLGVSVNLAKIASLNIIFVRSVFILLTLIGGWGIVAYLLLAFLLPAAKDTQLTREEKLKNFYLLNGIAAVTSGVYFILEPTGLFDFMSFLGIKATFFIPVLVFNALVFSYYAYGNSGEVLPKEFKRSLKDKRIKGVCGGFANYIGANSSTVRIAAIFFMLITGGIGLLIYILLSIFLKQESVAVTDEF